MDVKHKIDKLARDNRAQEREKLIDEIRSQCGMPRSEKKKRKLTTNKLVAIVSCCAVAVCAAIIIPCVLLLGGDGSKDRYCVSSEIVQQPSEYNIKQYNELHGTSILYLDWYEEPNISYMLEIKLKENNENIGISETLMNLRTSDSVKVQLTKKNIHIDYLDEIAKI
ncbi:MAG: hypothetical protein K2M48_01540, partial [Clostridiales bacterium]|nr:hypothetical protein [Clostridiales bacterium]